MSQRITKVRKKTASGFGDPIPIGAEAQNVTMSDGTVLQDVINQLRADSGMGHQVLTQSEYSALSTALQNNGTIYFISDGDVTNDNANHVQLTLSQYNSLSTAVQNNGTIYFVDDGSGGGTTHAANIQYNHNVSQLNANDVQSAIDEIKNFQDFKTKMHIYFDYENGGSTLASVRVAIGTGLISFYNDLKSYYGNSSAYVQETFFVRIKTSMCDCDCLVTADTLVNFSYIANTQDYGLISGAGWIDYTANPMTYEEVRFQRVVSYDTSNNVLIKDGGNLYLGVNKNTQYTQPGVMLHKEGYICLTNSTSVGSRGGIYFAYNNATGATAYIKESSSGNINISKNLLCDGSIYSRGIGSDIGVSVDNTTHGTKIQLVNIASGTQGLYSVNYYNGSTTVSNSIWMLYRGSDGAVRIKNIYDTGCSLPICTSDNTGQKMGALICNSATQVGFYGTWAGSTFSYKYVAVTTSDPRLKKNITNSNIDALSIINKIPMYAFDWKQENKHWDVGYIATEMYDIDPNLVMIPDLEEDKEKYWNVNDFYISGLQTKAIQELSKQNKQLKSQIKNLKQEVNELKQNLIRLENLIIQNK